MEAFAFEESWEVIRQVLPSNLEAIARQTGSCWRLHYSLWLPELYCDHFELTDLKAGESFKRWQAAANEVLLADRAYARCEAVGALLEQGVKVAVRCNGRSFPLLTEQGQRFNLRARLRKLKV